MELVVKIQITGSFALYAVKSHIDDIYIASLIKASYFITHNYPPKIFLYKNENGWQSDHYEKEIGLFIGGKIDEELNEG